MDGHRVWAHADAVALGEAVRAYLAGRTLASLAKEVGMDAAWATRLTQGRLPALTVEQLRRVEQALDTPKGALFISAGLVDPALDVPSAIDADPALNPEAKRSLHVLYDGLRRQ